MQLSDLVHRRDVVPTAARYARMADSELDVARAVLDALAHRTGRSHETIADMAATAAGDALDELRQLEVEGVVEHGPSGWTYTDRGLIFACQAARTRHFGGAERTLMDVLTFNAEFERTH